MSGTGISASYTMSGTESQRMVLPDRTLAQGSMPHPPTRCAAVLRYFAMRCAVLRSGMSLLGGFRIPQGRVQLGTNPPRSTAIILRACHAMSGTDIAFGALVLRACYAKSGTDIVYYPTRVLCQVRD
eukprot:3846133-Rhodomonas_salina.2